MKNIVLSITVILFMCNTLIAQTQEIKINKQTVKTDTTNTIKKDSIKKEIVIKDNWSKTKTKVEKNGVVCRTGRRHAARVVRVRLSIPQQQGRWLGLFRHMVAHSLPRLAAVPTPVNI